MAWKYVMFENKLAGVPEVLMIPVIFPDYLAHSRVAEIRTIMPGWHAGGVHPTSAGKIASIEAAGVGGDSETLNLAANLPDDLNIINMYHRCKDIELGKNNGR